MDDYHRDNENLWRSCSSRVRILALLALLFGAGSRALFAQSEKPDAPIAKPDAPVAKPDAVCDSQAAPPSAPCPTTQPAKDKDAKDGGHEKDEVPQRIFFFIPNFMTANDQPENAGPLTTGEKFNIAWHQYSDYSAHFGNILQAAISQAGNGIPHYGQGWIPFGERFLAMEGDQMTGSMLIYGVLPTLLHEDPRYLRKGRGSHVSRIFYAATRVLVTRTDSGKPTFNASSVFGQLGQAGISLTYYPPQDHSVKGLLQGWSVGQLYNIGWNQLKEFTPDLGAFLRRHRKAKNQHADSASVD